MRKSLIDSIGRATASKLMEDAVLQAIEENRKLGLADNAQKVQVVNGALCIVNAGRSVPLVAGGAVPSAPRHLSKQVPIA
jgi:hypothetical protein